MTHKTPDEQEGSSLPAHLSEPENAAHQVAAPQGQLVPLLSWRQRLMLLLMGLLVVASWSTLLVTAAGSNRIHLTAGEASPRSILATNKVTYLSSVLTERERQKMAEAVEKAYTPADEEIAGKRAAKAEEVLAYFEAIRNDTSAAHDERVKAIQETPNLMLSTGAISTALSVHDDDWQNVSAETLRVLGIVMQDDLREEEIIEVRRQIPRLINPALPDAQQELITALIRAFVMPNSFYDPQKTAELRQQAREEVEPIQRTIENGEAIVREGDIVTSLDIEEMEALGLLRQAVQWRDILGAVALVAIIVSALGTYIFYFHPDCWSRPRRALLLTLSLICTAGVAKLMVPGNTVLPYLFPLTTLSMLIALLLDTELSIITTACLSIIIGHMSGGSLEVTAYILLGGTVAALSVHRMEQLSAFVRAGLYTGLANLVTVIAFRFLLHDYSPVALLQLTGMSLANGALSASLTFAAFSLLGRAFGITTTLQLLELARPTHPLLRQLLLDAPGTYHHTLIVSNLAERAAATIGADPLLARVGSYYHDIGKILRPYFFSENQSAGENVHEKLDPVTSAQIIISHVTDGLVLAKRYGLPDRIRDFIPEHHGTLLVSYFYRTAVQNSADRDSIDESDFRYPGPKPRSKETAIVMLADSCEALIRADRPSTPEEMDHLIRQTISNRLADGQLDQCDLTLRDLEVIRGAFLGILQGIFHPRIQYPEMTLQERKQQSQGKHL